jgi:hypothetical protein
LEVLTKYQGKDYWERLNLRKLCGFLRSGEEQTDDKIGTPIERQKIYEEKLKEGLLLYRDRVIEYDWNSIGDDEFKRFQVTEDMFQEVQIAVCNLGFLDYEMGFYAALKILLNMDIDKNILSEINNSDR